MNNGTSMIILTKLYRLYLHCLTGTMIAVPFMFAHYIEQQYLLLSLNVVLVCGFHIAVVRGYVWINEAGCDLREQQRRSLYIVALAMAMTFALAASNPGAAGMLLGIGLIVGSAPRSMSTALYGLAAMLITLLLLLTSAHYQLPSAMLVMLPMLMLMGFMDRGHLYQLIHPASDSASVQQMACETLD